MHLQPISFDLILHPVNILFVCQNPITKLGSISGTGAGAGSNTGDNNVGRNRAWTRGEIGYEEEAKENHSKGTE